MQATDAGETTRQQLHTVGLLLAEWRAPEWASGAMVCPAAGQEGLLLCWVADNEQVTPLHRLISPWQAPPLDIGLRLDARGRAMTGDGSGTYLAVGYGGDKCEAQLWDMPSCQLIRTVPTHRTASALAFSRRHRLLLVRCENQIVAVPFEASTMTCRDIPAPGSQLLVLHPSEDLALVDHPNGLAIVEMPSGRLLKVLFFAGHHDLESAKRMLIERLRSEIDSAQSGKLLEPNIRRAGLDLLAAMQGNSLPGWMGCGLAGEEHVASASFSADGELLLCATNAGVRVYAWDSVMAATGDMPAPIASDDAEPITWHNAQGEPTPSAYVFDVCHDAKREQAIFGGMAGKIKSLDLRSGAVRMLVELPGRTPIHRLHLSASQSVLCCETRGLASGTHNSAALQVWNYPMLWQR